MEFSLRIERADGKIEETKVNLKGVTEEDLKAYEEKWCECNYLDTHPNAQAKYVENYLGERHGWICPSCKKFTQIG